MALCIDSNFQVDCHLFYGSHMNNLQQSCGDSLLYADVYEFTINPQVVSHC